MRIAFITETYPPEVNGVALTVARFVSYLRSKGHQIELIRPRQRSDGDAATAAPVAGGSPDWLSAGLPIPMYPDLRFGLMRPARLAKHFAATRPQLVHVVTEGPLGWAAVRAARQLGIPVTSDFRTNFHQYSRYYRLGWLSSAIGGYLRRLHNRTARTFVPTQRARAELLAAGFERVEVVGRGVDTVRFSPDRRSAALRAVWGVAEDCPVLLYVGRLAAEKNVGLALSAWQRALELVPSARMVLVGDGPLKAQLQRRYPAAHFAGMQTGDALAAHYASADLFLFPSLSETFGNVTVEALASGLPVIAFDAAAAGEFVEDQVCGRLIAPGQDAAFVEAVGVLASLHGELAPMRAAACQAAGRADWGAVLALLEDRFLEVVADAAATPSKLPACVA